MGRTPAVDADDGVGEVTAHHRSVGRSVGDGSHVAATVLAVRVVAGRCKGRRLVAPAGTSTRPTSDRVREALLNTLTSMGVVEGASVLDLFSGSGALGIEAVSRGASKATCVESDPIALDAMRRNISVCALFDDVDVVRADVERWLASTTETFDVAFADPPYAYDRWPELLEALPAALVVAESDRSIEPTESWEVLRQKTYGGTVVTILARAGRDTAAESEENTQ